MIPELSDNLDALKTIGWKVSRLAEKASLPKAIVDRYGWVPGEVLDFE